MDEIQLVDIGITIRDGKFGQERWPLAPVKHELRTLASTVMLHYHVLAHY